MLHFVKNVMHQPNVVTITAAYCMPAKRGKALRIWCAPGEYLRDHENGKLCLIFYQSGSPHLSFPTRILHTGSRYSLE